jgi:hypothetical protein
MRFQMFCVTGRLMQSTEFVDTLEGANGTPLGSHGQAILDVTERIARPGELILASLFSPHRQRSLPTCTINSWINSMLFNHPEQLAKIFASALAKGFFYTLSGFFIKLSKVVDGRITVDLECGEQGKESVFASIDSGDQAKADAQVKEWQNNGIIYNSEAGEHRLSLPVRDLNDLLFAGIFQETFGSAQMSQDQEYGTMYVLAGFPISVDIYSHFSHFIPPGDFPNLILELQREAQVRRDNGANYMRVASGYHAFNMNITELLALDLDKMKDGEICSVGDFNWADSSSIDINRLAIQKTGEGFRLGVAHQAENPRFATQLVPINFCEFWIYGAEIMQLPPSAA